MPLQKSDAEDNLVIINQKIAEIKKKIQLSEGQRKAHFEECDAEKKKNIERIKCLKKEVKEIYKKIAEPFSWSNSILGTNGHSTRDAGALRNKKLDEAIDFIDLKCIDLNKKLDIFKYQNKSKKMVLKKLAEEYRNLKTAASKKAGKSKIISNEPMCVLENQIHRVEMNMMEAEHVNKKYKTIRQHLLSDSIEFESCLKKLKKEIEKQNMEIRHLEIINKEALALRDITKGALMRYEIAALNAGKTRESQLQNFRQKVEDRKLELERLERRIFPTGRVVFEEGAGGGNGGQSNENTNQLVSQLEAAFAKLKVATGETEIEDVLPRFLSQKETKKRLEFLKKITEEEKRQLEKKKEIILGELEAFKFSEVKDAEQNQEEVEKLKYEIENEEKHYENCRKELDRVKDQLLGIGKCLYSFTLELQEVNDEKPPEPSESVTSYIEVLNCLVRKIKSGLSRIGSAGNLRDIKKELEHNQGFQVISPVTLQISLEETPLFPGLILQDEGKQLKNQQASLLVPETDDEEDVPNRIYLKRQAQLIVDAKSRKKFNRVLNFPKSKK